VKLLPESIWLALDPVDMRTGVDGLSLHVSRRWAALPATARPMCSATGAVRA